MICNMTIDTEFKALWMNQMSIAYSFFRMKNIHYDFMGDN